MELFVCTPPTCTVTLGLMSIKVFKYFLQSPKHDYQEFLFVDSVLNTGSKITGLNYSSTYLKLLAKLNLWFMDLLYVNILQLKIIRIYVQGKSLKLFSDCCIDLTCPSTMKYINERKKEIRNYFYLVNSIMRPSCVFERKREIINIL